MPSLCHVSARGNPRGNGQQPYVSLPGLVRREPQRLQAPWRPMHANNDPTHRGHGTRLPNNTGRHDLEPAPRDRLPRHLTSIRVLRTLPSGSLAETRTTHTACRRHLTSPVTPCAPAPAPWRGACGRKLVGADAELVDAAEHLGRVGVDPVRPGPLEFLPA